jgi:fibronectin type 3 domain-containing protein
MAEANGEGIILRFNEIKGTATTVKVNLGWFDPDSVVETDLIENDKSPMSLWWNKITLSIPAFGFKTIRVTRGTAPQEAGGVTAMFDSVGCQVAWADQPEAACFEVFRGTNSTFAPGTGTYVATVSANHYYDPTVKAGLTRTYYYAVRAVKAGRKSAFSTTAKAVPGLAADTMAPSAPVVTGQALHTSKVTLSWQPAVDNYAVTGYKVFRDGLQIANLAAVFNSWMDDAVKPDAAYSYTVKAFDGAGNLSSASSPVMIRTSQGSMP